MTRVVRLTPGRGPTTRSDDASAWPSLYPSPGGAVAEPFDEFDERDASAVLSVRGGDAVYGSHRREHRAHGFRTGAGVPKWTCRRYFPQEFFDQKRPATILTTWRRAPRRPAGPDADPSPSSIGPDRSFVRDRIVGRDHFHPRRRRERLVREVHVTESQYATPPHHHTACTRFVSTVTLSPSDTTPLVDRRFGWTPSLGPPQTCVSVEADDPSARNRATEPRTSSIHSVTSC